MRWIVKPKKSSGPKEGELREKIVFAFLPHKTYPISIGKVTLDEQWVWFERVVRVDEYYRGLFSGRLQWYKGYRYYLFPEYKVAS